MKTSSAKAKGRRLQQFVRDMLRIVLYKHGLVAEDIESRGMGQNGEDVILSPAAKKVLNLVIECKNVEKLNVPTVFSEHFERYKFKHSDALILLVHTKNRSETLATLRWSDLLYLLEQSINVRG